MKYYFSIDTLEESETYMEPVAVFRWYSDDKGDHPEMWENSEWVSYPELIAATGLGGDNDFEETTEEKAQDFIKTHS